MLPAPFSRCSMTAVGLASNGAIRSDTRRGQRCRFDYAGSLGVSADRTATDGPARHFSVLVAMPTAHRNALW